MVAQNQAVCFSVRKLLKLKTGMDRRMIMNNQKYDELFEQFKSIYEKEGDEAAFSYLDGYIEKNPNCPEAYLVRGEIDSQIDFQQALEDFEKAISIAPNISHSYLSRGLLYANSGDKNKAFADFSKAIELDANDAGAYVNRANMYLKFREFQKAINDCTKAIELSQDNFGAYFNRGLAYANIEEPAKALDDYNKVIELDPENAAAYFKRGFLHSHFGDVQKAICDYEKALKLDPDNKNAELVRDALRDLRNGKLPNTKTNIPLIIMIVGAVIYGTIVGCIVNSDPRNTGTEILIGVLIGAFFGIGLGPFLESVKDFFGTGFFGLLKKSISEEEAKETDKDFGCILGLLKGLLFCFFILSWALIKSPFITISKRVNGTNSPSSASRDEQKNELKMEKSTFTDPRDGKTYKTVKIGRQTWMAENLNYEAEGSKCYNNDPANATKYGRLYDWETAKKACPPGWHLPSNKEWQTLVDFAGGNSVGRILKSSSGWNNNGNGTDDFGFAAFPGGDGDSKGNFFNVGNYGSYWSSTDLNANYAYDLSMNFSSVNVNSNYYYKTNLYSARCVRD